MSGLRLIEPTVLYNLLNQETKYPCLSDPVFMLLIGERATRNFTAKQQLAALSNAQFQTLINV